MEAIIKHMVEISCHRDHNLLDVSILTAIGELCGTRQARVLAIFPLQGDIYVRARAWISDGRIATLEEGTDAEPPQLALACFPVLEQCFLAHQNRAIDISATGRHTLWLPVWLGERIASCLEIEHVGPFSAQTLDLLDGVISVYRNFQSLLDYSERDSLTGLLNRKTFDNYFAKIQAAVARQTAATPHGIDCAPDAELKAHWLAVFDIDHFKQVNDRFGHLYGDEVLILVANLMQSSFRATDRVFRFGGEEFVVLISSSTLENASKILDRFRRTIESHPFPQVGHITVSIGFARIPAFESPVAVVGHADQALYHAKSHGRNQVCHYEGLVQKGLLNTIKVANDTAEFF